jgi:hypothetical protein
VAVRNPGSIVKVGKWARSYRHRSMKLNPFGSYREQGQYINLRSTARGLPYLFTNSHLSLSKSYGHGQSFLSTFVEFWLGIRQNGRYWYL